MKVVKSITIAEMAEMAKLMYGDMVKAVVDIAKNIVVVDMGMHADGEAHLLEHGSVQKDLWGINLHPDDFGGDDFVEFDSMINIRPRQGNTSRHIDDPTIQQAIRDIIAHTVHD